MSIKFLLLLILSLGFVACQTNMSREFDGLKIGFDKHQVIDKIGSPRHMTRMNGEDRWYYMFYNDELRLQKEVHFKDGVVSYFGDKVKPANDNLPEVIDAKNEKVNFEALTEQEAKKEASKNAYVDYLKYEKKIKKQDKVDYLPDFEPVQ